MLFYFQKRPSQYDTRKQFCQIFIWGSLYRLLKEHHKGLYVEIVYVLWRRFDFDIFVLTF